MTHAHSVYRDANVTAQPIQSWPTQRIGGRKGLIKRFQFIKIFVCCIICTYAYKIDIDFYQ